MGADVIKIENAANGDDFCCFQPRLSGEGVPFLWVNRVKKGVALELTNEAAQRLAVELVAPATSSSGIFPAGSWSRSASATTCRNSALVSSTAASPSIAATTAMIDRLGLDPVIQAETGFMSMNDFPGTSQVSAPVLPLRTSPPA